MTESTDSIESSTSPVATEESITPPTEVDWMVRQQSDLVNLRVYNNERSVNTILMLPADQAATLADQLTAMVEEIEQTDNN